MPATVYTQLFSGSPAAAIHASMQQRLHPLICGVIMVPENVINPDVRPQGGQLYGRHCGSVESDWNGSG